MNISRFLEKSSASFDFRLARASDLLRKEERGAGSPPLPTRIAPLDEMAGGGLARGALIELVGGRSSGGFSIALSALAAATAAGESVALVDAGDQLDPRAAAEAGVDLERLLWVRPKRMKEAAMSVEMILATGFGLVVFDAGLRAVSRRDVPDVAWVRLSRLAKAHNAVCLFVTPAHVPTPAFHAIIRAAGAGASWGRESSPLLAGLRVNLSINRRKSPESATIAPLALGVQEEVG